MASYPLACFIAFYCDTDQLVYKQMYWIRMNFQLLQPLNVYTTQYSGVFW